MMGVNKVSNSTSFKHVASSPCGARGRVGGPPEAQGHAAPLPPEPAEGHVPGAASAAVLREPLVVVVVVPGEAAAQIRAGIDPAAAAAAVAPAPYLFLSLPLTTLSSISLHIAQFRYANVCRMTGLILPGKQLCQNLSLKVGVLRNKDGPANRHPRGMRGLRPPPPAAAPLLPVPTPGVAAVRKGRDPERGHLS